MNELADRQRRVTNLPQYQCKLADRQRRITNFMSFHNINARNAFQNEHIVRNEICSCKFSFGFHVTH